MQGATRLGTEHAAVALHAAGDCGQLLHEPARAPLEHAIDQGEQLQRHLFAAPRGSKQSEQSSQGKAVRAKQSAG
jgi:hypothetical protein